MVGMFERQNEVMDHLTGVMGSLVEATNVEGQSLFEGVIGEDGKIQQKGRDMAKSILNEAMILDISLVELEFYSELHFDRLIVNSPDEAQAIRKVRTSLRLQIAYESARRIVNSEAGNVIATNNGLQRNPRENIIGYANRLVAEHNRETIDLRDAERRKYGIPDPTLYKSKAELRRQNKIERLKLADQIRAETEAKIKARKDKITGENGVFIAEALGTHDADNPSIDADIEATPRIPRRNGLQGFFDKFRLPNRSGSTVITGLVLAFVLLITNRASSQANFINQDYNNWMTRQPIGVQVPKPWELERYEQMLQIQEIVYSVAEEGLIEKQSKAVGESVSDNPGIVTSAEGDISEAGTLITTNAIYEDNVSVTTTTEDTNAIIYQKAVLGAENDISYMGPAEYDSYQEEVAFINQWERPGLVVERTPTGFTVKHVQVSPLANGEYYKGKTHNAAFATDQMNKTMQKMGSLTPGEMIGLIKDKFVDFTQTIANVVNGFVDATYWDPVAEAYKTFTGSGSCWNVTIRNWVQMQINEIADNLGYPPIFLFMNQWTGNISVNNINQTHNVNHPYETYQLYEKRIDDDPNNDLAPGWTIAEEGGVGLPDNYSAYNTAFKKKMRELGWDVDVAIYMGFYFTDPSKTDVQVPGHENDPAYHEKMDSYGADNAVAEVILTFTKIPKDNNHAVDIAIDTSPDFISTQTEAPQWEVGNATEDVQVVYGSVKQESLVILVEP